MKISQSVVFQLSAGVDQDQFAVDQEMSHGALRFDEQQQPFGNAGPVDPAWLTSPCASPIPERPLRLLHRSWHWFGEDPSRASSSSMS